MIDLHTHILPGMDDGSPDIRCSLAMLEREREQGADVVCLTPHYYAERETIETFAVRRQEAFERLKDAAGDRKTEVPKLLPAAETAYFPHISEAEELLKLCIEGTKTILVEMPFSFWQDFEVEEIISLKLERGFLPVLAHPERFCLYRENQRKIERLMEHGIGIQINSASLCRILRRRNAFELFSRAPLPLLGSDCHNMTKRPPELSEARKILGKHFGPEFLAISDRTAGIVTGTDAGKGE